jgi:hypothetical protein
MRDFTLHNVAIRSLHLLDPRVETKNFRKRLLNLLTSLAQEIYESEPEEHAEDWTLEDSLNSYHSISVLRNNFKDVPDAFVIDREREEILIFEVEDFHPMPSHKAWQIIDLADSISWEFDWTVRVFISDRYANLKELDVEVLHASMVHEFGEIQINKESNTNKRKKVDWHPRCMVIRHTCRKCGKVIRNNELFEHRYDCDRVKKDGDV